MRIARQHVADQQAAIAAAGTRQPLAPGDAARDQVLGHRREVVMRKLLAFAHAGLVPGGTELAAAADIGDHIHTAARQP
jgi:hypothetical protein